MLPETMRSLEVSALEGPDSMSLVEKPVPSPKPGQVILKVHAAGLNYADVMQTRGLYVGGPKAPYVPGLECAGEVVAVGEGVSLPLGTRLMGMGGRTFAEYVALPAAMLMPLPDSWSFEQGAAFPIQWLTAHGCLRTCGRLKEGETVLVHAAAGGVGSAAVRLAKHYGAKVFATASSAEKLALAKKDGADVLINYTEEDFVSVIKEHTDGKGVDLILEMVGGETFLKNIDAVKSFGRIVVFGSASAKQAKVDNVRMIFQPVEYIGYHLSIMARTRPDLFMAQMKEVNGLIKEGVISPYAPTVHSLEEGASVLHAMENRKTTGKLVFTP